MQKYKLVFLSECNIRKHHHSEPEHGIDNFSFNSLNFDGLFSGDFLHVLRGRTKELYFPRRRSFQEMRSERRTSLYIYGIRQLHSRQRGGYIGHGKQDYSGPQGTAYQKDTSEGRPRCGPKPCLEILIDADSLRFPVIRHKNNYDEGHGKRHGKLVLKPSQPIFRAKGYECGNAYQVDRATWSAISEVPSRKGPTFLPLR